MKLAEGSGHGRPWGVSSPERHSVLRAAVSNGNEKTKNDGDCGIQWDTCVLHATSGFTVVPCFVWLTRLFQNPVLTLWYVALVLDGTTIWTNLGLFWHGIYWIQPSHQDKLVHELLLLQIRREMREKESGQQVLNLGSRWGEVPAFQWVTHCPKLTWWMIWAPEVGEKTPKPKSCLQKKFDSQDLNQQKCKWEARNKMGVYYLDHKRGAETGSWHEAGKIRDAFFWVRENIQWDVAGRSHI